MYRFVVSIINYKTPVETIRCVNSVLSVIDKKSDLVVMVDNFSNDGSIETLQEYISANNLQANVVLLANEVNGGFSYGNNTAIKQFEAKYYYLLNSDAIISNIDLDYITDVYRNNPGLGVLSTKVLNFDGSADPEGFNNRTIGNELVTAAQDGLIMSFMRKVFGVKPVVEERSDQAELLRVEWVSFCSVFVSSKAIREVGYLDSGYFMYREDNDYCRRTYEQGMWVGVVRSQSVLHESLGLSRQSLNRKPKFYYESRRRYYEKYYGKSGYYSANLMYCFGYAIDFLKSALLRRSKHNPDKAWLDIWV